MNIKFGIEQEFVFKNASNEYMDFENISYELFQKIVDKFPLHLNDNEVFECKSLETKPKRCYIEGIERFNNNGILFSTLPKGLEIRTLPSNNIDTLINEFAISFKFMKDLCTSHGLYPILTSSHPLKTSANKIKNKLTERELQIRTSEELDNALFSMLMHGMHINISIDINNDESFQKQLEKLNYYLPYIIPYSFSSPFWEGELFEGVSSRNYFQTTKRELIKIIERKGIKVIQIASFDACGDLKLLSALLYLLKGLFHSNLLLQSSKIIDINKIRQVSLSGFSDEIILKKSIQVLKLALKDNHNILSYLKDLAKTNEIYSMKIKRKFEKSKNIIESCSNMYNLDVSG